MHILYLIDSLAAGGAERSIVGLSSRFVELGVRLDVGYMHDPPGLHEELRAAGATLYPLAGPGGRPGRVGRATALVRELRPQLIHTTLFEADVAGRLASAFTGVPAVTSLVNVAYGPEQLRDRNLKAWKVRAARVIDGLSARRVVRFHSVTAHVAQVMGRRLGIPADRIDVIPRGRSPKRLGVPGIERRARIRAALGVADDTPLILAAARQEHQKGLDVLLEAFPLVLRQIPTARLMLAGRSGSQTELLQAIAERHRLNGAVRFLGQRPDVPDLMCGADLFVAPSRWEGFGGVLLEAMAMEVPIVATDLESFREFLDDRDMARFVPKEDPAALAEVLVLGLRDGEGSLRRARTARRRFLEQFTVDAVAVQMLEFYERALASNGRGR